MYVFVKRPSFLVRSLDFFSTFSLPKENQEPSDLKQFAIRLLLPGLLEVKEEMAKDGPWSAAGKLFGLVKMQTLITSYWSGRTEPLKQELIQQITIPLKYNMSALIENLASGSIFISALHPIYKVSKSVFSTSKTTDPVLLISNTAAFTLSSLSFLFFAYLKRETTIYCKSLRSELSGSSMPCTLPKKPDLFCGLFLKRIRITLDAKSD